VARQRSGHCGLGEARRPGTNTIVAGDVATALDFDTFGELTSMESDYDSAALLSFVYERDALGRIVSIAETVDAVTTTTE